MRGLAGRVAAAVAAGTVLSLTGCGSFFVYPGTAKSSTASTGNYVYVANGVTSNLAGFAIGTGTLTAVTSSPYSLPFAPLALAVTPANTFLYVGGSSQIVAYSIGSSGALTTINNGSPVGVANVQAMDISPDGNYLVALDGNQTTIDVFQINTTSGALTQLSGVTYAVSGVVTPRAIRFAPSGGLLFAALGTGGDLAYTFSSGSLTNVMYLSVGSTTADNALAVSPDSSTLYIARSGVSGGLAQYSIGSGGVLTSVALGKAGGQPFATVTDRAGGNVYVANKLDGTISGFGTTASGGVLPALGSSSYLSGPSVSAMAVDSSGKYLLAAAPGGAPDLTMYGFDASVAGKLDSLTTTATAASEPSGAMALAVTH